MYAERSNRIEQKRWMTRLGAGSVCVKNAFNCVVQNYHFAKTLHGAPQVPRSTCSILNARNEILQQIENSTVF